MAKKITDFLDMWDPNVDKQRLSDALHVLQMFKKCESPNEWVYTPFMCWVKLEQLEEFLEHLVNNKPLKDDTIEYRKRGT